MKVILKLIVLILVCFRIEAQVQSNQWDSYLGNYENNIQGITHVRMDLERKAPIEGYNYVLVTGVEYLEYENGFPSDETLAELYDLEKSIKVYLDSLYENIAVGSFMYDGKRLQYFYLKTNSNVKKVLKKFYLERYREFDYYINVKKDNNWLYYNDFLFPNETAMLYNSNLKVIANFKKIGDELDIPRKVFHYIQFNDQKDLFTFQEEILKYDFILEKIEAWKETSLFELKISRRDPISMETIYPLIGQLLKLAKKSNGSYLGWETTVQKK